MATTTNAVAVAPLLLTSRVLLAGSTEPVKGLFIAFRLIKSAGDTKAGQVARVLETPLEEMFEKQLKGKKGAEKERYQRIFEQYKAENAETVDDPSDQFVLGITDIDGYLEPVYEHSNPWRDRLARLEPDTFKFAVDEEYAALLIRHPSPDVARAATRLLNKASAGRADVNFTDTSVWGPLPADPDLAALVGTPGPVLQRLKIKKGSGANGEQFIIHVPSTPDAYVPLRSDDPKKWWLYAAMPHDSLPTVREQVKDTVTALGLLKYPATGDQDHPYSVRDIEKVIATIDSKPANATNKEKQRWRAALVHSMLDFHGALQATAALFQQHQAEGHAFKPVNWEAAHDADSWGSEIGVPVQFEGKAVPRLERGGVIGPVTAKNLNDWIKARHTKTPEHLVTIGNGVMMLARGAFAFNAWSQLLKALGCEYGMKSGHSYRQLMAEGGGGAIKNSVHKTGLASDMTGGRQRTSTSQWPIRFEAEFRRVHGFEIKLEKELQKKQQSLDALLAARDKERQASKKEVTAATEAKDKLLAPGSPKPPTKQQLKNADDRLTSANKNAAAIEAKYEPKVTEATAKCDQAKSAFDNARTTGNTDTSRLPDYWRMRFCLYGHSIYDVFSKEPQTRQTAIETVQAAIARWAGIPWPVASSSRFDTGGLDGEFLEFIRQKYLKGIADEDTNPWLKEQFSETYAFALQLLLLADTKIPPALATLPVSGRKTGRIASHDLIDRYFRPTITQWNVNFYEKDGGTDMIKASQPTDGDSDFPARADAKSWLNISAIGHGCQMHRIGAHSWDVRDRASFPEHYPRKPLMVPPMAFPMDKYMAFEKSRHEAGDIVAAIEDITASSAAAPQLAQGNFVIEIRKRLPGSNVTEHVAAILPSAVDGPFFKSWNRTLETVNAPAYKADPRAARKPAGAQLSLVINDLDPTRQASLDAVLAFFNGDTKFATKHFMILEAGPKLTSYLPTDPLVTGKQLATALQAARTALSNEATAAKDQAAKDKAAADKAAADRAAALKAAPDKATAKSIARENAAAEAAERKKRKDAPAPPKWNAEDWSVLLQPVFTNANYKSTELLFVPEHVIMLPARENAAHLEWWHYQHHSVDKPGNTWAKLLEECGFARAVLETPAEGAIDPTGEPVHLGLGYSSGVKDPTTGKWKNRGELDSVPWPPSAEIAERPSNYDPLVDQVLASDDNEPT